MATAKGRGAARPAAGRTRKTPADELPEVEPIEIEADDMLDLLQKVALGKVKATPLQVRAAIAAVQYTHTRTKDGGKKEARQAAAEKAAGGRLAPKEPPKLKVING